MTPASPIDRGYRGYIFDLDGTVYLGDQLLPGVHHLITELRKRGSRTVFISNNPTRDPQMYAEKLTRFGLPTPVGDIINTVVTMSAWLVRHTPGAQVFVIGEEPLRAAIERAGLTLCDDPARIDVVVASYDHQFDYRKLQIAFDALWQYRHALLVTTNPDTYCPLPDGRGEPDSAAIVAAIEACTGVRCVANVGKPDRFMADTVLDLLDLPPEDCVLVGDRLYTDVAMAVKAGMASALVLTGETTRDMVKAATGINQPTYILDPIDELLVLPHSTTTSD